MATLPSGDPLRLSMSGDQVDPVLVLAKPSGIRRNVRAFIQVSVGIGTLNRH